jgi:hypothetical protein
MLLCCDPEGGYARWVCPGCHYELRVPFSCKTRFCPSCIKYLKSRDSPFRFLGYVPGSLFHLSRTLGAVGFFG